MFEYNRKDLKYNLSYGQGDYAYLTGDFDLIKMISKQRPQERQLIKDLKYLHKQVCGGAWASYLNGYADYQDNLDDFLNYNTFIITRNEGFYNKSIGGGHHNPAAGLNCEEFINALENFTIKDGKTPACVLRIIEAIEGGLIQDIFEDFEYNLKRQLYDTMEEQEKQDREFWIEEVLKPKLKGKYNRITKEFKRECETVYKIN